MGKTDFGDARLSKRLTKIVAGVLEAPDKSFPSLLDDTALEGAYRFFSNNDGVTPERILRPHVQATMEQMADEAPALIVHDTSTMSFDPSGARRGLGRVRSAGRPSSPTCPWQSRSGKSRCRVDQPGPAVPNNNASIQRARSGSPSSRRAQATTVLPVAMIEVLHAVTRTARDVLLAVAALGGHLKHNGEPGWITLRRGYEKLRTRGAPAHCSDV